MRVIVVKRKSFLSITTLKNDVFYFYSLTLNDEFRDKFEIFSSFDHYSEQKNDSLFPLQFHN